MKKHLALLITINCLLILSQGCQDFFPEEKVNPKKQEKNSSLQKTNDDFFDDKPVYHTDWEEEE
jgi:hypothetical protein